MAGIGGGGIGRFANRKKQLSQQDAAPSAAAASGGKNQQPNVSVATASNNENASAVVDGNNTTATDTTEMEIERPSTAFNSFNDRPATSGSHGFSSIGNMFGVGDQEMMAAGGEGGEMFFTSTPTELDNANDFGFGVGMVGGGEEEEGGGAFHHGFGGEEQTDGNNGNNNNNGESNLTRSY